MSVIMSEINLNFQNYKSYITNKTVYLCASGDSINNFTPPENDVIYVTVNSSFIKLKELGIVADFCFVQDYSATKDYIDKIKPSEALFIGAYHQPAPWGFTDENIALFSGKKYFLCYNDYTEFQKDIINKPLWDKGRSVAFSAMQFLLWCEPKEIYLVGCDCTTKRFDNSKSGIDSNHTILFWKKIKEFAGKNYPNIKIYSINPISLTEVFPCKQ